ncbi:10902_t:CDS:2, partial [Entrophospora sp. SA101]
WNSTFKAWTRLLEIKAAIVSLCDSMCEDVDREVRENGRKLKKILLKDNEWLFLENFVRILKDFDDITKLFSSRDFVSLSLVYPTIRVLIEKVKKINTNNTNINTEYDDEYIPPIDDHDLLTELESYNDEQGESPLVEEIGLILSVLDPRFKHLKFLQENEKDHIYNLISNKLNEKKNNHQLQNQQSQSLYLQLSPTPQQQSQSSTIQQQSLYSQLLSSPTPEQQPLYFQPSSPTLKQQSLYSQSSPPMLQQQSLYSQSSPLALQQYINTSNNIHCAMDGPTIFDSVFDNSLDDDLIW